MRGDVTVCSWLVVVLQDAGRGGCFGLAARAGPGLGRGFEEHGALLSALGGEGDPPTGWGRARACVMRGGASLRQVQPPPQAAQILKVAFSDLCEQESRGKR